jgi:hypothetical protein
VEMYQFNELVWVTLSSHDAKTASTWYQGPGWYYNPLDETGKKLPIQCAAKSEAANYHAGLLDALNICGADGWSVAAFLPSRPEVGNLTTQMMAKMLRGIVGLSPDGPCFVLQRRVAT